MAFTISGTLAIDETTGTQNAGSTGSDKTGNDVTLATVQANTGGFYTLVTQLATQLGSNPTGAAVSSSGLNTNGTSDTSTGGAMITGLGPGVIDLAFTGSTGGTLNGLQALSGTNTPLLTSDGTAIYLYSYTGPDIVGLDENNVVIGRKSVNGQPSASGDPVFVAYLQPVDATGAVLTSDVGAVGAKVWLVEYDEIRHPVTTNPDDSLSLTNLNVATSTFIDFNLNNAPSGQNLFMMFGDGTPTLTDVTIVVTGKDPINQSDTTAAITSGDTVNTGQGGGPTTLGTNSQQIVEGEGLYFTFVTGADPNVTVPNLSPGEAGLESNIKFTALKGATAGEFKVVQVSSSDDATIELTASTTVNQSGIDYIDNLHNNTPKEIDSVTIITPTVKSKGQTFASETFVVTKPASGTPPTITTNTGNVITVTFGAETAKIQGIEADYTIQYHTVGEHQRLLIDNVGSTNDAYDAPFDIGGFRLISSALTPTPFSAMAFQDDGPAITATSNLVFANTSNPPPSTDVGGTGIFKYDTGTDTHPLPFSATNSDFTSVALASGTVGGVAITNLSTSWASETATSAVFNFSFDYVSNNPNPGSTTSATGTLTFDKDADTYTVRLGNEIDSFSVVRTSQAQGFTGYNIDTTVPIDQTPINQQPPVSVARLTSDFQVQFSGMQSVGGNTPVAITSGSDRAFAPGEVLSASNSWVSVSGAAVGVAGDTMQNGEVLDMDFFTANPYGNTAAVPDATARGIFMKFDGIGSEDLVVILKLVDETTHATTTRALIVDSEDIIIKTPSTRANNFHPLANPASYGVTLDQNDGLVIIENNDFNFANEHYVIQGAQVLTSTEGLTGSGYNLNGAVGATGASTGATLVFGNEVNEGSSSNPNEPGEAGTWDTDVVKISDMGFVSSATPDTTLVFNAAVIDNDGDATATQQLNVRIEGDTIFSGGPDADTDGALAAVTTVVDDFNPATNTLDFTTAGTSTNYKEVTTPAASFADFVTAANTALDGTVDYYFGVVGGNGYLAVDGDGIGITAILQLTGVTDMASSNIV